MSPTSKTPSPEIRQPWSLILAIHSLASLLAVAGSRSVTSTPRTATSLAMHRLRSVLAGCRQPSVRYVTPLVPAYHSSKILRSVLGIAASMVPSRQFLRRRHSALADRPADPVGPPPGSGQRLLRDTTSGINVWPITSSPILELSDGQKTTLHGRRDLRIAALSGA